MKRNGHFSATKRDVKSGTNARGIANREKKNIAGAHQGPREVSYCHAARVGDGNVFRFNAAD